MLSHFSHVQLFAILWTVAYQAPLSMEFSRQAQPLILTLDEGYLLTAALPDLQYVIAPLGPPAPAQPPLLGRGLMFLAAAPGLGHRVAPPGGGPWPRTQGSSSRPLPLTSDTEWLLFAVPVPSQPGTLGRCP